MIDVKEVAELIAQEDVLLAALDALLVKVVPTVVLDAMALVQAYVQIIALRNADLDVLGKVEVVTEDAIQDVGEAAVENE